MNVFQMTERHRLYKEKWIIQKKNNIEIVMNYCRVITPHPWGDRFQTYKLEIGRVSSNYLIVNRISYNYFSTSPIELPPGLGWTLFKKLSDGKSVCVIIKIPKQENGANDIPNFNNV